MCIKGLETHPRLRRVSTHVVESIASARSTRDLDITPLSMQLMAAVTPMPPPVPAAVQRVGT